MLKLRLQRRGKRNYATYRVVVAEAGAPIKGRFVADLGSYNPHTDAFAVDGEVVKKWMGDGAKPSATVHNLLIENKIIKGDKVKSWRPKKKKDESTSEKTSTDAKVDPKEAQKAAKEDSEENSSSKDAVDEKPEKAANKPKTKDNEGS